MATFNVPTKEEVNATNQGILTACRVLLVSCQIYTQHTRIVKLH